MNSWNVSPEAMFRLVDWISTLKVPYSKNYEGRPKLPLYDTDDVTSLASLYREYPFDFHTELLTFHQRHTSYSCSSHH